MLPTREILVVRTVQYAHKTSPSMRLSIERHAIPADAGAGPQLPVSSRYHSKWREYEQICISEPYESPTQDQSVLSKHSASIGSEPPPVSIYAVTKQPIGMFFCRIWPHRMAPAAAMPGVVAGANAADIDGEDMAVDPPNLPEMFAASAAVPFRYSL